MTSANPHSTQDVIGSLAAWSNLKSTYGPYLRSNTKNKQTTTFFRFRDCLRQQCWDWNSGDWMMHNKRLYLILLLMLGHEISAKITGDSENKFYSNSWVIVTPKDASYVNMLAEMHDFVNKGQLGALEGHFLLEHKRISGRTRRSLVTQTQRLMRDPYVTFAAQQKILKRKKRGFSDPLYNSQWYLNNTGKVFEFLLFFLN